MKRKIKFLRIFTVIFVVVMCFAGCDGKQTAAETGGTSAKGKINIKDIVWSVDEGIMDGERYVLLNYTNNTKYTLASFEITFREKVQLPEEEKSTFYSDIQKKFEISDSDMDLLKKQPITMHAETERVVDPGQSVANVNCCYYQGFFYLKDITHYNLVEPDIATIQYIDDDQILTVYYDYSSKKYSAEAETEVACQWTQTELGNKIPKPDVKVIESGRDDEKIFMFDAYGLSLEQFNAYIAECKSLGYTVEPRSFEGFYSADNADGYNVYLHYDENDYSMSGTIKAPETKTE